MRWMRKPLIAAPMVLGMVFSGFGTAARGADAAQGGEWFRGQTVRPSADTVPSGPNANGGGRDFGQPPQPAGAQPAVQNAPGDFPQDALHDWVVATARAARSRAMLHLAEKQLSDTIRDVQWTFEQTREFREAVAAEKKAYDAYTAERQKALQSVLNDPKYQAAIQFRDDLGDKIAKVRAAAKPLPVPREDMLALASQKLQYASDAHNMERDALDRNPAVQDARQRMVQASARVSDMRASFDTSIRMNPQIAEARRNLDMARVELITAEAYYSAAAAAGAVQTDYSYYRHRWDGLASPVVAGGWGPYGYNPGY